MVRFPLSWSEYSGPIEMFASRIGYDDPQIVLTIGRSVAGFLQRGPMEGNVSFSLQELSPAKGPARGEASWVVSGPRPGPSGRVEYDVDRLGE